MNLHNIMKNCTRCKKTHDDQKYKMCYKCRYEANDYYFLTKESRKEERKKASKKYNDNNKEKIKQRSKQYRVLNKEKIAKYEASEKRKDWCKRWIKDKKINDPSLFLLYAAKKRAKNSNIIFNITKDDILEVYPLDNKCPMLGIELLPNDRYSSDNSPTLDRIIPKNGYVKGNILVISSRANRIKNDATIEELENILLFLRKNANLIS